MSRKCLHCSNCLKNHSLGISQIDGSNFKIFKCQKCSRLYGEGDSDVFDDLDFTDEELITLELKNRIECPLCKKFRKDPEGALADRKIRMNGEDFSYIYVNSKREMFYCRNHPDKNLNRYYFRNTKEKVTLTLREFFKEVSKSGSLYKTIRMKCIKGWDSKTNKKRQQISDENYNSSVIFCRSLVDFLLRVNMPKTLISSICKKSRPTINKWEKALQSDIEERKITNGENGEKETLFETSIYIDEEYLNDLKDDTKFDGEVITYTPYKSNV